MIWIPLVVPVLFFAAALIFFRKRVVWWEPIIPILATVLVIFFFRYVGTKSLTKDTEFWGNYITETRYYQEWNEWIEQTCYRTVSCGKNCSYTVPYDCSYCRTHPACWTIVTNDGKEHDISSSLYDYYKKKFGSKPLFQDMRRDYHTIDGDMFYVKYPKTYDAFEFYASEHPYENRVQASTSIFNYSRVTEEDKIKYSLYDYPEIKDNSLEAILAPKQLKILVSEQRRINYLNGMLGMKKEARVWICVWISNDDENAFKQEAYWKRGNKNEFVVCIGVNKDRTINWCRTFGWNKKKAIDVEVRNYFMAQKKLDLVEGGKFLYNEVDKNWARLSFEEFNYLAIEPPQWAVITTWIVSVVSCLVLYFWIINNEFEVDEK